MAELPSALSYHELISLICLEAGRIMEDTSGELASSLPTSTVAVERRLDMLRQASAGIAAYSAVADILNRRVNESDVLS